MSAAPQPSPDALLVPIAPRIPAGEVAFATLRQAIISLALPPGMPLSRANLAARLQVSQTPVREALSRLQDEGLVTVVPSASTHVARIDLDNARQAHFLRVSLELELGRKLAGAPPPALAARLAEHLAEQRRLIGQDGFAAADDAFHARLYEAAGMSGLWALVRSRSGHLDRLRRLNLPSPGKMEAVVEEHGRIAEAILARDTAATEAALRQHFSATFSRIPAVLARYPDYFAPG
ncbi:GntR family transcriptional regulator [Roseomonas marmotae]|uniref:GntR family transcriptional regulator n=1 Tax=Roseomonas marmotae TaxID=2768161 RepID=A0ABS3KJE0_9PROT|nr:GntR family transcriptional regulator [Roseomonas marmotae]MBO1076728.1 GntR family transcriptional regulator [Roseomonas marmotae]QTI77973.1 GntR family transcriptional regulator [Roseomonas marmotae]